MALITLDGTELRRSDGSVHSWIHKGLYGPPEYRGRNALIVGRPGAFGAPLVKARRIIDVGQQIKGLGSTEALAQQAFLVLADELRALYESTTADALGKELRVYAPLYGIASGYRKLNGRWLNSIEQVTVGGFMQVLAVRFECYDNPPDWVAVP